jgi:hypothetical protein
MLDRLASGKATLAQVAADFATRKWVKPKPLTEAQTWGLEDLPPTDPNSWDAVTIDPRVTPAQYQVLFNAAKNTR